MSEENLKLTFVCLLTLTLSILFNMFVVRDRITEMVIRDLKRNYVPGPYEPGFDPDKVPPGSVSKE